MNIGIVGWRKFNNYELFKVVVEDYIPKNSTIISGGCIGADLLAEKYADEFKLKKIIYKPEVGIGPARFHIRNKKIVDDSDLLIAFLHSESKGTVSTINFAKKKKIKIIIYDIDNNVIIEENY